MVLHDRDQKRGGEFLRKLRGAGGTRIKISQPPPHPVVNDFQSCYLIQSAQVSVTKCDAKLSNRVRNISFIWPPPTVLQPHCLRAPEGVKALVSYIITSI